MWSTYFVGRSVKQMKEYIVQAIAKETIESFDAHNAPELIRCKDCKHWESEDGKFGICKICHSVSSSNGWFCADGERKEGR